MSGTTVPQDEPSTPIDTLAAVLPTLTRALQRDQLIGWALILVVGAVSVALPWWIGWSRSSNGEGETSFYFLGACLGFWVAFKIATHVRRSHENRIVPILAKTAGLIYDQSGTGFAARIPARMLPVGNREGEDLVQGSIAGRHISFAETCVMSRGDKPVPLFQGFVAMVPNTVELPYYLVAPEKETERGLLSGRVIDINGLTRVRTLAGADGQTYGVWCNRSGACRLPGFDDVIDAIVGLDRQIGPNARLFTASCDGKITYISMKFQRDLFRVGGLFAGKNKMLRDIQGAYADLTLPLRIAAVIFKAEQSVLSATLHHE